MLRSARRHSGKAGLDRPFRVGSGSVDHGGAIPEPDFSERVHALREAELRRLPPGASTVLHGGAAEAWYFEWFAQAYPSDIARHIGVEYFAAEPKDLPSNVTWLRRTLGDIAPVGDGEVDLVFAGQVVEHLWPDDVAGFLLESHRVLAPGGALVMDSPNRRVTEAISWLHPEHTAEFSVAEVVELVRLAGFDVEDVRGVVLGYDRERHIFLDIEDESMPWEDRAALAGDSPEDSFIWWLTARRADRAPARAELTYRAHALAHAFRERRFRQLHSPLEVSRGQDRVPHVSSPPGYGGAMLHGPYVPLDAGRWRATFRLELQQIAVPPEAVAAHLDVCSAPNALVHGTRDIAAHELDGGGRWTASTLDFALPTMVMGLELRVFASAGVQLGAQVFVDLARADDAPTGVLGGLAAPAYTPEPRTVELLAMLGRRTRGRITPRRLARPRG